MRKVSIKEIGACLTFLMFQSHKFMMWRVFANKRNQKYMALAKINISSRNNVDIENRYLCFVNWREVEIKECSFSLAIKIIFLFFVHVWWARLKRLNIVTDILKFYEVLFCTYCKGLLCLKNSHYAYIPLYMHKTLTILGNKTKK